MTSDREINCDAWRMPSSDVPRTTFTVRLGQVMEFSGKKRSQAPRLQSNEYTDSMSEWMAIWNDDGRMWIDARWIT